MFRWFTVVSIFLTIFISSYVFFKEPFEAYISYLVFLLFFPAFIIKYGIPKYPIYLFIVPLIFGVAYCYAGLNTFPQFWKIFIGFFSSMLFYHYVIQVFDFDLKMIFKYYMKGCVIVCIIGIVQLIAYHAGVKPLYNYNWIFNKWSLTVGGLGLRVNSVFSEPAYMAAVVAPAFFVSVFNMSVRDAIFVTKRQSIIIIVAYFLTFSSLGIIGIFLAILLLLINFGFVKYAAIFGPLFIFTFQYSYENIPEFRDRYDGTFEIFSTGNYKSYDIHGSSFVLYNNSHVAWENFKQHPLIGTGLGSHPIAFDKYSLTKLAGAVEIDFNKMDANSMFLRLMSETGLYGLSLMIIFIFRCWIFKSRAKDTETWVMSNGIVLIIILYLLRQGHYFLNGFPFFLWMFYYLYKDNKGQLVRNKEIEEKRIEEKRLAGLDA